MKTNARYDKIWSKSDDSGGMVMALVKCPECGKENVSDSAEMCPDCGYGIKTHFEKIKMEKEEKIRKQKQEEEDEQRRKKGTKN